MFAKEEAQITCAWASIPRSGKVAGVQAHGWTLLSTIFHLGVLKQGTPPKQEYVVWFWGFLKKQKHKKAPFRKNTHTHILNFQSSTWRKL